MAKVLALLLELPLLEVAVAEVVGDVFLLGWFLGELGKDTLM